MSPRRRTTAGSSSKAVAYIRVSTDEQTNGPEAQAAAIARWCAHRGVELVATFSERVSGKAPLDERPQMMAALAALEVHGAGLLIAHKRDRVARDVVNAALIERLAVRTGARVVTTDGVGDGDGPEAGLMRAIVDAFAQYERLLIASRTKLALAAKKARGELTGSAPFGYQAGADGKTLEPNEAEMAVVRRARELRASGLSLRKVAAQLSAEGAVSRAGTPIQFTQVARMAGGEDG